MDIGQLVVCCRNLEFKEGRRWYRKRVMGYLFKCQIKSYVMMNFKICLSYCFFEWPDIAIKNPFCSKGGDDILPCAMDYCNKEPFFHSKGGDDILPIYMLWTTSPIINKYIYIYIYIYIICIYTIDGWDK